MQGDRSQAHSGERLLIVSNRAPFRIIHEGDRERVEPTVGGVATTFLHLLETHGGLWIAWSGGTETPVQLHVSGKHRPFSISFIGLSERQISHYYWNTCNRGLWPLMHSMAHECHFGPPDWEVYREVNELFARSCAEQLEPGDTIWFQDFPLAVFPGLLQQSHPALPVGFFWHVPFPARDVLKDLPSAQEL